MSDLHVFQTPARPVTGKRTRFRVHEDSADGAAVAAAAATGAGDAMQLDTPMVRPRPPLTPAAPRQRRTVSQDKVVHVDTPVPARTLPVVLGTRSG